MKVLVSEKKNLVEVLLKQKPIYVCSSIIIVMKAICRLIKHEYTILKVLIDFFLTNIV